METGGCDYLECSFEHFEVVVFIAEIAIAVFYFLSLYLKQSIISMQVIRIERVFPKMKTESFIYTA